MKKFMMYAAVFGKKGNFKMPKLANLDIDKILYTDLDVFEPHIFYKVKKMNLDHLDFVRRNRLVKICIPDEIFDNYEYSLYMDYKHPTAIDFDDLLGCLESDSDILVSQHKKRDCIYDEGIACIVKEKDNKKVIMKQLDFYKSENYPNHNGLYAAYWLFRRHTKRLKEFSRLWWEEVERHSCRDQISLPYVAWKHDVKISVYKKNGGD